VLKEKLRYWDESGSADKILHTLEMNDTELTLIEMANQQPDFMLDEIKYEHKVELPPFGHIKADLFARTKVGDKVSNWFIEVERKRKQPAKLKAKCQFYRDYLLKTYDTVWQNNPPKIIWLVPTIEFGKWLKNHLDNFMAEFKDACLVITRADLTEVVLGGSYGK
jgi:hypothetical protein